MLPVACTIVVLALLAFAPADRLRAETSAADSSAADLTAARDLLGSMHARDGKTGFQYTADSFLGDVRGDSILLRGNAVVTHQGVVLEAGHMVYARTAGMVTARGLVDSNGAAVGEPLLKRGSETLRGTHIRYDTRSEEAFIREGIIRRDKGIYRGEGIHTLSAGEFHITRGSYTTCDYSSPHFDFYSPRIKVLVDDMAIARPVYVRIKGRRVMWIPFYIFSLRQDRQSGILTPSFGRRPVSFGSPQREWELRNLGYYIAPNDYWDVLLAADWRQRSGWLARVKSAYARRYLLNGQVETRLQRHQSGGTGRLNWWASINHNQELGESMGLRASGTFQSNKNFHRDNSASLRDRLNRTLRSNFSFNKRWRRSGNSLSINARHTRNLDSGRSDRVLPEVSFRKSRKPLWGSAGARGGNSADQPWYSRIYYDGSTRLRNIRRSSATDTTTRTSANANLNLGSQHAPLTWLHFTPRLATTWRNDDLRSSSGSVKGVRSDRLDASVRVTQTFYGMFHPQIGAVTAFRHVFRPSLSMRYQATHTDAGGVPVTGGGGRWRQNRPININLDNTFWVKLQEGEEESKLRLAQLNFSTSYDVDRKDRPLSDLQSTLGIAARRYLDSRLTLRAGFYGDGGKLRLLEPRLSRFEVRTSVRLFDRRSPEPASGAYGRGSSNLASAPYQRGMAAQTFGYESGLQRDIRPLDRGRRLQVSHYYSRSRSAWSSFTRSWLRAAVGWSLRRHWHLNYSLNYNLSLEGEALLSSGRITSELLSVQRQFHDWTATLNIEPSHFHRGRTFYFKAQLTDIPQIKFERGDRRL